MIFQFRLFLSQTHCLISHSFPSSEMPNYDVLVPVLLKEGIDQLPKHCKLTPGKQPIRRQNSSEIQNSVMCVFIDPFSGGESVILLESFITKIKDTTKLMISSQLHCCQAICDKKLWHLDRKLKPATI